MDKIDGGGRMREGEEYGVRRCLGEGNIGEPLRRFQAEMETVYPRLSL
jgi:hypothetical protein